MNLNPFTFGDTEPAVWLASKLNELQDEKSTRSVSVVLNKSNQVIKSISLIKDSNAKIALAHLYTKDIQERVAANNAIPEELKSRICNVLVTKLTCIIRYTNAYKKAGKLINGINWI